MEATMKIKVAIGVLGLASMMVPTQAHHSFAAEYDAKQVVKLTGPVTRVEWSNPHVYFYIDVKDAESGRVTNWAFEMGAPAVLQKRGWTRSSMTIGDLVTVEGTRAKDGGTHGNARSVTLTVSGKRLGAGSSEGDPTAKQ
jgi:Family of unknown function (DUF6152)